MTLITGATGGLGSEVARQLRQLDPNRRIAVMLRNPENSMAKSLRQEGFEVRIADYEDPIALERAFEGVALLYFVSGSDIQRRGLQHANVLEAAAKTQVGHVFYTSVSLNGLPEDSPLYGAMQVHMDTEASLREIGLTYTILRHNLYSEVVPMFLGSRDQLLASKTVFLPAGTGKTAFVPRHELAEAAAKLLQYPEEHANRVYEMNGSRAVDFAEIATSLSTILESSIPYVSPDAELFAQTMSAHGVPAEYIGMMQAFGAGIASGAFEPNHTDLELVLGRKSMPIDSFLKQVYQ